MSNPFAIPTLDVEVQKIEGVTNGASVAWKITLMSPDTKGSRKLGYRAAGSVGNNGKDVTFVTQPEVHDHRLDRWTEMPISHRPDIRKQFENLARSGAVALIKSRRDTFERLVI